MVNFNYLVIDNSKGVNVFNLAKCKSWSINVIKVVKDGADTIFNVELVVDGNIFPIKHKIVGTVSKETYLKILNEVLDGRNNIPCFGIQSEIDDGYRLIIKSNYYYEEPLPPLTPFSITGKPKRYKSEIPDVFWDVEIESVDEEDLF